MREKKISNNRSLDIFILKKGALEDIFISVEGGEQERESSLQEASRVVFKAEENAEVEEGAKKNTETHESHEEHMKHLAGTSNTSVWFFFSRKFGDKPCLRIGASEKCNILSI